MRDDLFIKVVVLGIMLLFVGAGVTGSNLQSSDLSNILQEETKTTFDELKTYVIEMTFSTPEIYDQGEYISVDFDKSSYPVSNAGEPMIPCVHEMLTFPLGTKIMNVNIICSDFEEIRVDKKIVPAQKPLPLNGKKHIIELFEDKKIYENDELYPSNWVSYHTSGGLYNDEHVTFLSLNLFPIRYSPKNNILLYIKNARITVDYKPPKEPFKTGSLYDLLIIAPAAFSAKLQPLIAHKNSLTPPINTKLMTTQDIYASYSGKDKAEQIKYCIKDAIEKWGIKYVLLVGGLKGLFNCDADDEDNWHVPARYSNLDLDGFPEEKYLCDLYFADVYDDISNFCSWDSDNDGVFGEWRWEGGSMQIDDRDLCPDVSVGRLPCRNVWEVRVMVDKIINYESSNKKNEPWFKRMLLLGGDSYDDTSPGDKGEIEGMNANIEAHKWLEPLGFTYVGLWPSIVDPSDTDLKPANFINEQNKGSGFTFLSGHGDCGSWFNHQYYTDFQNWANIHCLRLLFLRNRYKLPVAVIAGCNTASFDKDFSKGFSSYTIECFSWKYTRKLFSGSIATIGNTAICFGRGGTSYTDTYNGNLSVRFFEIYSEGVDFLGEIWSEVIERYVVKFTAAEDMVHCKTVENWMLLGDPSLRIGGYP